MILSNMAETHPSDYVPPELVEKLQNPRIVVLCDRYVGVTPLTGTDGKPVSQFHRKIVFQKLDESTTATQYSLVPGSAIPLVSKGKIIRREWKEGIRHIRTEFVANETGKATFINEVPSPLRRR